MDAIFSLVMTTALLLGSPGPAPLALAGVGASFGFRQGAGFLGGILAGLLVVIALVATGLGTLFNTYPFVQKVCQVLGTAYLCYIAYKIATAKGGIGSVQGSAPSFKDGFILNLINPKAYAAFLAIFANNMLNQFTPMANVLLTVISCFLVAVLVDGLWMAMGVKLRPLFAKPAQAKWLRLIFSGALLVSLVITFVR